MVLVFSGMWKVICFCLSLEPDQEGLNSDAAETRGRRDVNGCVDLIKYDLDFKKPSCCFLIITVWREKSPN